MVWDGTEPLYGVDNITADPVAGQLFVAEEGGNMEVVIIDNDGDVAPFLRVEGHPDSEIAGVAFSPDETRMYFSSQRGPTEKRLGDLYPEVADTRPVGMVFEIEGPFKQMQAARIVDRTNAGERPRALARPLLRRRRIVGRRRRRRRAGRSRATGPRLAVASRPMTAIEAPYVNLLDPAFYVDPGDAYRWLRDNAPAYWDPVQRSVGDQPLPGCRRRREERRALLVVVRIAAAHRPARGHLDDQQGRS